MGALSFFWITLGLAFIVYGTRVLPFLVSKKIQKNKFVLLLATALPLAIMFLLVVHSLSQSANFIFGAIGVIVTALMHIKYKQAFLSIIAGTVVYIGLVNYL